MAPVSPGCCPLPKSRHSGCFCGNSTSRLLLPGCPQPKSPSWSLCGRSIAGPLAIIIATSEHEAKQQTSPSQAGEGGRITETSKEFSVLAVDGGVHVPVCTEALGASGGDGHWKPQWWVVLAQLKLMVPRSLSVVWPRKLPSSGHDCLSLEMTPAFSHTFGPLKDGGWE